MGERYKSFSEFWPFYLREHSHPLNRKLHFIGTFIVLGLLLFSVITQNYYALICMPFAGYGFAWFGHFVIEKNRPATFKYPFWSLLADFKMFFLMLSFKLR